MMRLVPTIPQALLPLEKPVFGPVFGSGMVVQSLKPIPVWGFARPGTKLELSLDHEVIRTRAGKDWRWKVVFSSREPGYQPMVLKLKIAGATEKDALTLEGILAGEVWFCTGQSNMELGVGAAVDGTAELAAAHDPGLRLFLIHKTSSPIPLGSLDGRWKPATPQNVGEHGWGGFSAVAFHFGRTLRKALDCPVGLIQAAYGGARIHPFLNPRELKGRVLGELKGEYRNAMEVWNQEISVSRSGKVELQEGILSQESARTLHPHQAYDQYDTIKVSTVWNAMIHPVLPFSCRGVLWYQGESDTGNARVYPARLEALYRGFQRDFGTREMHLVQIAPWKYGSDADLLDIWQAQYDFSRRHRIPMVSTVDVGNMDDIHPLDKKPVGERLARQALRHTYRQDLPGGSPSYLGVRRVDKGFLVSFDTHGAGLALNAGSRLEGCTQVKGFRFHFPDGTTSEVPGSIEGNKVRLCCEEKGRVTAISYAWTMDGAGNLVNGQDEPAFPFHHDLV